MYKYLEIDPANTLIPLKIFSLLFVATGGIFVLIAAWDYKGEIRRLQQEQYYYQPRRSLAMTVSAILVTIGISIFLTLIRQSVYHIPY